MFINNLGQIPHFLQILAYLENDARKQSHKYDYEQRAIRILERGNDKCGMMVIGYRQLRTHKQEHHSY